MIYDNYLNKVKKAAKVKNGIMRFKILIITVLAILIATFVAYSSIKGNIPDGIKLPTSLTYGEEFDPDSNPFLSEVVGYEYQEIGSDTWSGTKPSDVGEYYIRAITKKVGGNRYSKPQKFVIEPKPLAISVEQTEIVYGDAIIPQIEGLTYGDELQGLRFKFDSLTERKTVVNPVITEVMVVNKDGRDVTFNYAIKANNKEISFNQKLIELTPDVFGKVYDGTPVSYQNTYTITKGNTNSYNDALDTIELTTLIKDESGEVIKEAILPGKYTVHFDEIKILNNGTLQNNYDVQTKTMDFVIEKRDIKISTSTNEFLYDGLIHKDNTFTYIENELVDGHKILVNEDMPVTSVMNYQEASTLNQFTVKILDKDNNDLTDCYNVSYEYGTLSILKRDIKITTGSSTIEYDGVIHENRDFTYNALELVLGQEVRIITELMPSIKNASSIFNEFEIKIYDLSSNEDLTYNYNVSYDYGIIEIIKRQVEVSLNRIDGELIYDGNKIPYDSKSYTIDKGSLVDGEELELTLNLIDEEENVITAAIDSGKYNYKAIGYTIIGGLEDNYEIIYNVDNITFEILKREVKISPVIEEYIFNNNEYIYDGTKFNLLDSTSFVYDEAILITVHFEQAGVEVAALNAGSYDLIIESISEGVLKNHNVEFINGIFTITPREIIIRPYIDQNKTNIYNTKAYKYDSNSYQIYDVLKEELKEPSTLSWGGAFKDITVKYYLNGVEVNEAINAGSYIVKLNTYGFEGIEANYNVTIYDEGIDLLIEKKKTIIKPALKNSSKVYDGEEFIYPGDFYEVSLENGEVLPKDEIYLDVNIKLGVKFYIGKDEVSPINAATYTIKASEIIADSDVYNNYIIELSEETIEYTIEAVKLTIKPKASDTEGIYNGNYLEYEHDSYIITNENKLVGQDKLIVYTVTDFAPVNAGSYVISFDKEKTMLDGGILQNYDITYLEGKLKVIPKEVTIKPYFNGLYNDLNKYDKVYDGKIFSYEYGYIINDGVNEFIDRLPYHNVLTNLDDILNSKLLKVKYYQNGLMIDAIDAGNYRAVIDLASVLGSDEITSSNYIIKNSDEVINLVINKREVVIKPRFEATNLNPEPDKKIYDGIEYSYNGLFEIILDNGLKPDGPLFNLISGNDLKLNILAKLCGAPIDRILNAGVYSLYASSYIGNDKTNNNYIITLSEESIIYTILKRKVSISPINEYSELDLYYDGNDFNNKIVNDYQYEYNFDYKEFVSGEGVTIKVRTNNLAPAINASSYTLEIYDYFYNEGTLEENYDLRIEETHIVIKPREVIVNIIDQKPFTYNNEEFNYVIDNNYEVFDTKFDNQRYVGNLPCYNHLISNQDTINSFILSYYRMDNDNYPLPNLSSNAINAGTYAIYINNYTGSDYVDINYKISYYDNTSSVGKLQIMPQKLDIYPILGDNELGLHSYDITYDPLGYVYDGGYIVNDGKEKLINALPYDKHLNNNHKFEISYYQNGELAIARNVGLYKAKLYSILFEDGLTNINFEFNYKESALKINKLNIKIASYMKENNVNYSALEYIYNPNVFTITNIIDNEKYINDLKLVLSVEIINSLGEITNLYNADTYRIKLTGFSASDENLNNYNIEIDSRYFEFIINKASFDIKSSYSGVLGSYTGKEQLLEFYSEEIKLLGNDSIRVSLETSDKLINACKYTVGIISHECIGNTLDSNYELNYLLSDIEIAKAKVLLAPTSRSFIYTGRMPIYGDSYFEIIDIDGNPWDYKHLYLDSEVFTISTRYVDLDTLNPTKPVDVGTYGVVAKAVIGPNLYDNYEFNFSEVPTEFSILKRKLVIGPSKSLSDYRGNEEGYQYDNSTYELPYISNDDGLNDLGFNNDVLLRVYYIDEFGSYILSDMNIDEIIYPEGIKVINGKPYIPGRYRILVGSVDIFDKLNRRVNDNYDISYEESILDIFSIDIKFKPTATSKIYDGLELVASKDAILIDDSYLISGDKLQIEVDYYYFENGKYILLDGFPINVGNYYIKVKSARVIVGEGNEHDDSIYNLLPSDEFVEILINKRTVVLKGSLNEELTYNFNKQQADINWSYSTTDESNHFIGNDWIDSKTLKYNYRYKNQIFDFILSAGRYYLTVDLKTIGFVSNNELCLKNYDVRFEALSFEVNKLPITIKYSDVVYQYDKTHHKIDLDKDLEIIYFGDDPKVKEGVANLSVTIKEIYFKYNNLVVDHEPFEAGIYELFFDSNKVYINNDSFSNFSITYSAAKYEIEKCSIKLTLNNKPVIFNNQEQSADVTIGISPLGTKLELRYKYSYNDMLIDGKPIHVGRYKVMVANAIEYYYDEINEKYIIHDTTSRNYEFIFEGNDEIVINVFEFILETVDIKTPFVNHEYYHDGSYANSENGPSIKFKVYYEFINSDGSRNKAIEYPKEEGKYAIIVDKSTIYIPGAYSSDYNITLSDNFGILTIYRVNENIELNDVNIHFDEGKNSRYPNYNIGTLAASIDVKLKFRISDSFGNTYSDSDVLNVGRYIITVIGYEVYDYNEFNELLTNNFIISVNGILLSPTMNIDIDECPYINLIINKSKIEIRANGKEEIYTGLSLKRNEKEYYVEGLGYDDELLSATSTIYKDGKIYTGDIIHAGSYEIRISNPVWNVLDMNNYEDEIGYQNGFYKISPYDPNLYNFESKLPNNKIYDGITEKVLYKEKILEDGTIIEPLYKYEVSKDNGKTWIVTNGLKVAGKYRVKFIGYRFSGGSSLDGDIISYDEATNVNNKKPIIGFEISKLDIMVNTGSLDAYYTGNSIYALDGYEVLYDKLPKNHIIKGDMNSPDAVKALDASRNGVINKTPAIIYDSSDDSIVTDCFSIKYNNYGTIRVHKRPIKVVSGTTLDAVYNGSLNPLVNHNFEILAGDNINLNYAYADIKCLSPSLIYEVVYSTELFNVTDKPVDNTLVIQISNNDRIVDSNFIIDYSEKGKLQMSKLDIVVGLNMDHRIVNKYYNGTDFNLSSLIKSSVDINSLGDDFSYKNSLRFEYVRDKLNNLVVSRAVSKIKNAGGYIITINKDDFKITSYGANDDDLTSNYNIIFDDSVLNLEVFIKPRTIEVETASSLKVWDGLDLTNIKFKNVSSKKEGYGLANGEAISCVDSSIIPSMENGIRVVNRVINNEQTYKIGYDSFDSFVETTDNYIININKYGTLEVTNKIDSLKCGNNQYEGREYSLELIIFDAYYDNRLIENLKIEARGIYLDVLKTVGIYKLDGVNIINILVGDKIMNDLALDISNMEAYFEITKRKIAMKPKDNQVVYDGLSHGLREEDFSDGINYVIKSNSLISGHSVYSVSIMNAFGMDIKSNNDPGGEYMLINDVIIHDEFGNDVTMYYDINYGNGSFRDWVNLEEYGGIIRINKIQINYRTKDYEGNYDGYFHNCGSAQILNINQIMKNHKVVYNNMYIKNATDGTENLSDFDIVLIDNPNISVKNKYYDLNCEHYGNVIIHKKKLTIKTHFATKEYDGKALVDHTLDVMDFDGLIPGHKWDMYFTGSQTEVGESLNTISIIDSHIYEDGIDVIDNYIITVIPGSLRVTRSSSFPLIVVNNSPKIKNKRTYCTII